MSACELCVDAGGTVLWKDARLRVVAVADPLHPVFCRVIWSAHVREVTDLPAVERQFLFDAVCGVESALRRVFPAAKINLASLGNVTPHLHWHVIARFADDPHFPAPVWALPRHDRPVDVPIDWQARVRTQLESTLS